MDEKVKEIIGAILKTDADTLSSSASPDTIEGWDSLKHLSIVFALEEEFGVEFLDDELDAMHSIDDIVKVLNAHV